MRLTVLGAGAVRPNAGGACSGYLLETGGATLLVECGPGVLARLLLHRQLHEVDAVLVSHDHVDHWLDLVTLQMALAYAPGPKRASPLPVYAGPGVPPTFRGVGDAIGDGFWRDIAFVAFDPERPLLLGDVVVGMAPSAHSRPSWSMRFESGGRVLGYTGDTAPCDRVRDHVRSADLLLAEATLGVDGDPDPASGHMTAAEAAQLAQGADVGRLVLTHYFVERGGDAMVAAATEHCEMRVHLAKEGDVYEV